MIQEKGEANIKFSPINILAYLDCSLRCLVQLTSSLGWSNSKEDMPPKPFMKQLITELCQLLEAFHCGKGQSSTSSYMGLSITRNVMLILNHILTELQHSNVKVTSVHLTLPINPSYDS